jgi:hypothetical protein
MKGMHGREQRERERRLRQRGEEERFMAVNCGDGPGLAYIQRKFDEIDNTAHRCHICLRESGTEDYDYDIDALLATSVRSSLQHANTYFREIVDYVAIIAISSLPCWFIDCRHS